MFLFVLLKIMQKKVPSLSVNGYNVSVAKYSFVNAEIL